MATEPEGRFLYVTKTNFGAVAVFSVDSSGALAAVPGSPFPIGEGTAERLYPLAAYPAKSCPAAK